MKARRLTVIALGAIAISTASMSVAQANPDTSGAGTRIAIGDSVMLGAKWNLLNRQDFTRVDAVVNRQAATGPGLLAQLGRELPKNVVVHLGTNGTYPISTCRKIIRQAGPTRKVFLMTVKVPRRWEAVNNQMLRECAGDFPADRVYLVDWNWAATRHGQWLYDDGVHLRPDGARAFSRIINAAIAKAYPPVMSICHPICPFQPGADRRPTYLNPRVPLVTSPPIPWLSGHQVVPEAS